MVTLKKIKFSERTLLLKEAQRWKNLFMKKAKFWRQRIFGLSFKNEGKTFSYILIDLKINLHKVMAGNWDGAM